MRLDCIFLLNKTLYQKELRKVFLSNEGVKCEPLCNDYGKKPIKVTLERSATEYVRMMLITFLCARTQGTHYEPHKNVLFCEFTYEKILYENCSKIL